MGTIQEHTLAVMTNGDVYYLTEKTTERLLDKMDSRAATFTFNDIKSQKQTTLQIINISSVVEPKVVSDGVRY